jgi:flagellar hook-basal body complex protein FliE
VPWRLRCDTRRRRCGSPALLGHALSKGPRGKTRDASSSHGSPGCRESDRQLQGHDEQGPRGLEQPQNESARLQREVQLENPEVSLEEAMVAMQTSQIGFQGVLSVRNRLVQAHTDIMNMQV